MNQENQIHINILTIKMGKGRTKKILKYKILKPVKNLFFFKAFFDLSERIKLFGEFEITPYEKFSSDFGSIYWYLQYMLLKNGVLEMEKNEINDEYLTFFSETEINFEWLYLKDEGNYMISCIDGDWILEIYNNKILNTVIKYGFYFSSIPV